MLSSIDHVILKTILFERFNGKLELKFQIKGGNGFLSDAAQWGGYEVNTPLHKSTV